MNIYIYIYIYIVYTQSNWKKRLLLMDMYVQPFIMTVGLSAYPLGYFFGSSGTGSRSRSSVDHQYSLLLASSHLQCFTLIPCVREFTNISK